MFGSKLRSWMENHIVRPRKKANKNKNGNSGNLATSSTQNGHKGTSLQGDTSAVASPARRSEVSPIQYHTTSRAGWQSPEDNTVSPKSDHYPFRHTVKSNSSPRNMIRNSSYTLENNSSNSQYYQYSKSVDTKQLSKTIDSHRKHPGTDDAIRQSSFQMNSSNHFSTTTSASSSTSNELLEPQNPPSAITKQQYAYTELIDNKNRSMNTGKKEKQFSIKNNSPMGHRAAMGSTPAANVNQYQKNDSANNHEDNYHEKHQHPHQHSHQHQQHQQHNQQHHQQQQHQQSHLQQPDNTNNALGNEKLSTFKEPNENRYGKILSRVDGANRNGSISGGNKFSVNNYDRCNANIQLQTNKCDNTSVNCTNNNNTINNNQSQQHHQLQQHAPYYHPQQVPPKQHQQQQQQQQNVPSHQNHNLSSGGLHNVSVMENGNGYNHPQALLTVNNSSTAIVRRNGNETNRNMLRTSARYASTLAAPSGGNHQLAHMINSLSSPESAYSTGYSTDGTSPGATYTPEYYINMRTGTHYFPRGVNSAVIEQSRQKFGLNKIDETSGCEITNSLHRRTESCDLNRRNSYQTNGIVNSQTNVITSNSSVQTIIQSNGLSPDVQRRLALQTYKGLESPSPRQRCRIKTNPWFSNVDPAVTNHINFNTKKVEMDTSSTSSGIKSSSDAGPDEKNGKKVVSSDSESSSSSTEIEVNKKIFSPNTIRKRKVELNSIKDIINEQHPGLVNGAGQNESDEDATLNEMMGKFDESYCYEKETDILSDSDPTECVSDLDTGQDGGDECDTDDLLDIDYIDNGSALEIIDKSHFENKGSCTYFNFQPEKRVSRIRKARRNVDETASCRRKKRLTRTRKRESRETSNSRDVSVSTSRERGSKSLGGTPICLRRNQSDDVQSSSDMIPLGNRSNSLTFTEIHSIRSRFLAIAESEKALLKADMEADIKYKQLIHEAETILVSMKTTALKDTPVGSPRRISNVPTNKRVEMLRNCESDIRRDVKAQKPNEIGELPPVPPRKPAAAASTDLCGDAPLSSTFQDNLLLNKRIEVLRYETTSAPNSPKSCRFSPRKTHISNFINQNVEPTDLLRRRSSPEPTKNDPPAGKLSPQLQLNGRKMISPPKSPTPRRRFRSQSPKVVIDSDTDSETELIGIKRIQKRGINLELNGNKENLMQKNNRKLKQKIDVNSKMTNQNIDDILNQNVPLSSQSKIIEKKPLMSFRSIDVGNKNSEIFYCPQSEPLKRKIYSGSSTLEKLKKSLEMDSDLPKKALLEKISLLRRERYAAKAQTEKTNDPRLSNDVDCCENTVNFNHKRQLILNTIEDLKRSLEDQSVELCGLNDDD